MGALVLTFLTYDAPHHKSERFLTELVAQGLRPDLVVGAPWRKLKVPPAFKVSAAHRPRHPRVLCNQLGLEYVCKPHEEVTEGDLGIVGGARILPQSVIEGFTVGILNLHPGRIPENRGLSNIARAVQHGWPQVVTAHLIDRRIDAGRVLFARKVPINLGDTVLDVGERILDVAVAMLVPAVTMSDEWGGEPVPEECGGYEKPLTEDDERAIFDAGWQRYVLEHSGVLA